MQPDTINIEHARDILSKYFGRPVEEVETSELEGLYDQLHKEARQTPYSAEQESMIVSLNLEMSSRSTE